MKRILSLCALTLGALSATAATLSPIQLLNPAGSTSGQAIVSTGPSTPPAWANTTASGLVAQAANTVVANVTASSASPTAVALPSCSATNSALRYTSATGFSCGTTFALTSGTLAQFAATTSAQLAGVISDETGSGSAVFGTSPTLVTPNLGTPSALTLTNATGLPVSGLTGLGTGVATSLATAVTGSGGSVLATSPTISGLTTTGVLGAASITASSTITPSQTAGIVGTTTNNNANAGSVGEYPTPTNLTGVSLTSGVVANVSSVSLTAGDWDVTGVASFAPAGTTVMVGVLAGISTASATAGAAGTFAGLNGSFGTGLGQNFSAPTVRISLSTTTTVYLIASAGFTTSTCTASGYLRARRVR